MFIVFGILLCRVILMLYIGFFNFFNFNDVWNVVYAGRDDPGTHNHTYNAYQLYLEYWARVRLMNMLLYEH